MVHAVCCDTSAITIQLSGGGGGGGAHQLLSLLRGRRMKNTAAVRTCSTLAVARSVR